MGSPPGGWVGQLAIYLDLHRLSRRCLTRTAPREITWPTNEPFWHGSAQVCRLQVGGFGHVSGIFAFVGHVLGMCLACFRYFGIFWFCFGTFGSVLADFY